jgi:hypothetical protein
MAASSGILERIVQPKTGGFSPEHARYVLSLTFPKASINRYLKLSEKAQQGTLSSGEEAELDDYLNANTLLSILQSKARASLKKSRSRAGA